MFGRFGTIRFSKTSNAGKWKHQHEWFYILGPELYMMHLSYSHEHVRNRSYCDLSTTPEDQECDCVCLCGGCVPQQMHMICRGARSWVEVTWPAVHERRRTWPHNVRVPFRLRCARREADCTGAVASKKKCKNKMLRWKIIFLSKTNHAMQPTAQCIM